MSMDAFDDNASIATVGTANRMSDDDEVNVDNTGDEPTQTEICEWCDGAGCEECLGSAAAPQITRNDSTNYPDVSTLFVSPTPKTLDKQGVREAMHTAIQAVSRLLNTSYDDAECLLRALDWNHSKLLDLWVELGNEAVRIQTGQYNKTDNSFDDVITYNPMATSSEDGRADTQTESKLIDGIPSGSSNNNNSSSSSGDGEGDKDKLYTCCVAMCGDYPANECFFFPCGHVVCRLCLGDKLESDLKDGVTGVGARCPGMGCSKEDCNHQDCGACRQLIPKSTFRHILGGQKYRKFEDFLGQHFVSHSKFHQRCPGPRCDLIIESDKTTANKQSFTCLCGERVCIRCGGPPHEPCPCDLARKFKEYLHSDTATIDFLASATKRCPKCNVVIMKDRNCNHMQCSMCKYHFCWLCKAEWGSNTHDNYYSCKKFNEMAKKGEFFEEEQQQRDMNLRRQAVQTYIAQHEKHEVAYRRCMEELFKLGTSSTYLNLDLVVRDALTTSSTAHSMLMWSNAVLYFLPDSAHKDLTRAHITRLSESLANIDKLLLDHKHDYLAFNKPDIRDKLADLVLPFKDDVQRISKFVSEADSKLDYEAKSSSIDSKEWTCLQCNHTHEDADAIHNTIFKSFTSSPTSSSSSSSDTDSNRSKHKHGAEPRATAITLVDKTGKAIMTSFCQKCSACRLHAEPDCRICVGSSRGW